MSLTQRGHAAPCPCPYCERDDLRAQLAAEKEAHRASIDANNKAMTFNMGPPVACNLHLDDLPDCSECVDLRAQLAEATRDEAEAHAIAAVYLGERDAAVLRAEAAESALAKEREETRIAWETHRARHLRTMRASMDQHTADLQEMAEDAQLARKQLGEAERMVEAAERVVQAARWPNRSAGNLESVIAAYDAARKGDGAT